MCGGPGLEGLRDHPGRGALLRREVGVPGAEGDAVRIADGRDDAELEREVEISDQAAEECRLLRVLASEVGDVWPDDVEELQADGGHAAKVPGPRGAFGCRPIVSTSTHVWNPAGYISSTDGTKGGRPPAGRKACVPLLVVQVAGEVLPRSNWAG